MSNRERVGVLGGTFDPIHNAHIDIARAALDCAHLDRILFVVAARPPHKDEGDCAPPEDRYAMAAAAVAGEPRMEVSRVELDRDGPSYTAETLGILQQDFPSADLFLIIGMDSLVDLPGWKDPEAILQRARLLVAPRPGKWRIPKELQGEYDLLPFDQTTLSSTEVRNRLTTGASLEEFLPPDVCRYVRKHGLYTARPSDSQG